MTPLPKGTSPYTPIGKHHLATSAVSTTAAIAFFTFVVRYWNSRTRGEGNQNKLNRLWNYFANSGGATTDRIQVSRFSLRSILTAPMSSSSNGSSYTKIENNKNEIADSRREIRDNKKDIQSVLNYWFGQYTPEKSQKMLWMIAASSREHREKIDAEIASRFEDLLRELLSSSSSGSSDEPSSPMWKQWCLDPDGIYGAHGKIATIIVLDQFSRHILRHYENNNEQQPLPTKESLDRLALATAELLVKDHQSELDCGMVPLPMRVFALMPYRHASTMESVKYVQQTVEEIASLEEQNEAMVGRFRKATNRRLAVLQDEQRRTGKAKFAEATKRQFTDDDILETFPFEADMTPSLQHPIHKTMVQFLTEQGIHPKSKKANAPTKKAGIIVSLSGGVDSMVIASVLSHLKVFCGYDHLTVLAVHIDYANRPESGAEADYVRRYCEDQLGGNIEFSCRRIDEVTRGITARDDYERIAREIRYTSYREAVTRTKEIMGLVSKEERNQTIVGVMLGHHRGDLRENVLSNAHKGCGPLDLSGMTAVSKNDGITLFRPLLPLEKSFVFDYAHKFGVPYYKDTTPHWSTRGKLRSKLLPLLEEIYGDGSMNNLSNLAVESDECRALMNKSMIAPFLQTIVRTPMGIFFDTASFKHQPLFFWKVVLREALHSVGLGMFSDKSVEAFLERIRVKKLKAAWLQCRKDYGVYLRQDGRVFVLYKTSFPWNKKDAYKLDGQALEFDTEKHVGPWVVRTEVVQHSLLESPKVFHDSLQSPENLLAKKAVLSMEAFMEGKVEYFVAAPASETDEVKPLVFRSFSKLDRPRAWKNCDLRVQTTLPLLGIDESLISKDSKTERLVRVSMILKNSDGEE